MSNPNNPNDRANDRDLNDARPEVATDARAAARQEQVKADHAALEESARRVESSVHSTPVQEAATDPAAAAKQDQMKADHDALQESARRVESSVPADVRNTPVQQASDDLRSAAETPSNDPRVNTLRAEQRATEEERERDRR
jgi:hypothetical protein